MNNKKLSIVFLVIMFLFILTNSCFATPYIDDLVTAEYPYYIIIQEPSTKDYYLITSKVTSRVWGETDVVFDSYTEKNIKVYKYDDVSWNYIELTYSDRNINEIPGCHFFTGIHDTPYTPLSKLVVTWDKTNSFIKYSNYDIMPTEGDSPFFLQTPLMGYLRIRTMAQATEGVELETVLAQIVKIVGLTLVVVVSYLGLRKALRLLSMLLHQA